MCVLFEAEGRTILEPLLRVGNGLRLRMLFLLLHCLQEAMQDLVRHNTMKLFNNL